MFRTPVDHLKLKMKPHPYPYTNRLDQEGTLYQGIMDLYHIPIFVGEFYQDYFICDVVDLDKCHILLGRS